MRTVMTNIEVYAAIIHGPPSIHAFKIMVT